MFFIQILGLSLIFQTKMQDTKLDDRTNKIRWQRERLQPWKSVGAHLFYLKIFQNFQARLGPRKGKIKVLNLNWSSDECKKPFKVWGYPDMALKYLLQKAVFCIKAPEWSKIAITKDTAQLLKVSQVKIQERQKSTLPIQAATEIQGWLWSQKF